MTFIRVIDPDQASGKLAKIYQRVSGPGGQVDNVLQIHSLRPHSLEGHMALYKAVLHHPGNSLPKWFLEAVGVLVSLQNDCEYCAEHHSQGLRRLLAKKPEDADVYLAQLRSNQPGRPFTDAQLAALAYAKKLTVNPGSIRPEDIQQLRNAGLDDGDWKHS
jgi:uncharacterized peroxidase-related enzyme